MKYQLESCAFSQWKDGKKTVNFLFSIGEHGPSRLSKYWRGLKTGQPRHGSFKNFSFRKQGVGDHRGF